MKYFLRLLLLIKAPKSNSIASFLSEVKLIWEITVEFILRVNIPFPLIESKFDMNVVMALRVRMVP